MIWALKINWDHRFTGIWIIWLHTRQINNPCNTFYLKKKILFNQNFFFSDDSMGYFWTYLHGPSNVSFWYRSLAAVRSPPTTSKQTQKVFNWTLLKLKSEFSSWSSGYFLQRQLECMRAWCCSYFFKDTAVIRISIMSVQVSGNTIHWNRISFHFFSLFFLENLYQLSCNAFYFC